MLAFFNILAVYPTGNSQMSGTVAQFRDAGFGGAVVATEYSPVAFETMADDAHTAMRTDGRQHMDRALETVERVGFARGHRHLKRLVVVVAACIAFSHVCLLRNVGLPTWSAFSF
jgi:hypothetical protein